MYQQISIIGNLGGDPEMRHLEDGTPVTTFSVATHERWTDRETGEVREKTTWFRVSAWRRLAEVCNEYLNKGRQVFVTGTIKASAYTAEDGSARASLELRAQRVQFLGNGNGNGSPPPEEAEEDLPF